MMPTSEVWTDRDRMRVCVHEAGHAVAELILSLQYQYSEYPPEAVLARVAEDLSESNAGQVGEGRTYGGPGDVYTWPYVSSSEWPSDDDDDNDDDDGSSSFWRVREFTQQAVKEFWGDERQLAEDRLLIYLAGPEAERIWGVSSGSENYTAEAQEYSRWDKPRRKFTVQPLWVDFMEKFDYVLDPHHDLARVLFLAWALRKRVDRKRKLVTYPFPPFLFNGEDEDPEGFEEFFCSLTADNRRHLQGFSSRATALLVEHWPMVEAIAKGLFDRGVLTYAECQALAEAAI